MHFNKEPFLLNTQHIIQLPFVRGLVLRQGRAAPVCRGTKVCLVALRDLLPPALRCEVLRRRLHEVADSSN